MGKDAVPAEEDVVDARQIFMAAFRHRVTSYLVAVSTDGGAETFNQVQQSFVNDAEADQVVNIVVRLIQANRGKYDGGDSELRAVVVTSPCRAQVSFLLQKLIGNMILNNFFCRFFCFEKKFTISAASKATTFLSSTSTTSEFPKRHRFW
jgi:AAA domain